MDVVSEDIVEWLNKEAQLTDIPQLAKAADEIARLRTKIEQLTVLLKRHDRCWKKLHPREYIGELRGNTRAALATDGRDGQPQG